MKTMRIPKDWNKLIDQKIVTEEMLDVVLHSLMVHCYQSCHKYGYPKYWDRYMEKKDTILRKLKPLCIYRRLVEYDYVGYEYVGYAYERDESTNPENMDIVLQAIMEDRVRYAEGRISELSFAAGLNYMWVEVNDISKPKGYEYSLFYVVGERGWHLEIDETQLDKYDLPIYEFGDIPNDEKKNILPCSEAYCDKFVKFVEQEDISIIARCMDAENLSGLESYALGRVVPDSSTGNYYYRLIATSCLVAHLFHYYDWKEAKSSHYYNLIDDKVMDIIRKNTELVVDKSMAAIKKDIRYQCKELEQKVENYIEYGGQSQMLEDIVDEFLSIINCLENPMKILVRIEELNQMVVPTLLALDESKKKMIRTMQDLVEFVNQFKNIICDERNCMKQEYVMLHYKQLKEKYNFRGLAERTQKIFERLKSREKE